MPNQLFTFRNSLISGFTRFTQFVPSLVGAILVLLIGWLVAQLIARLVERLLHAARFENLVSRLGMSNSLKQTFGPSFTTTHVFAILAKWFVMLIFVQAAATLLAMPQVTAIINSIILFIPNLIVALIILMAGALGAQIAGRLVETSMARTGVSSPRLFSLITRYAIIGFAGIAAVNQIGIASNLLDILFAGLVGSLALALGLAFGLGGQGVAQDLTRSWYEQGKRGGPGGGGLKAVETPSSPPPSKKLS